MLLIRMWKTTKSHKKSHRMGKKGLKQAVAPQTTSNPYQYTKRQPSVSTSDYGIRYAHILTAFGLPAKLAYLMKTISQ